MIRATGAKLRMLASERDIGLSASFLDAVCGERDDCGDEDDMSPGCRVAVAQVQACCDWLMANEAPVIRYRDGASARLEKVEASRYGSQQQFVGVQVKRNDAQITRGQWARDSIRTIGDWKPSVLLFDFKLVPESLRLCLLSVHVPGLFFVA